MEVVVIVAFIAMIASFFAIIYPYNKKLFPTRKRALIITGASFGVMIGAAIMAVASDPKLQKQMAEQRAKDEKAALTVKAENDRKSRQSEAEKTSKLRLELAGIWTQIKGQSGACDDANNSVIRALATNNIYDSYSAANDGEEICRQSWSNLKSLRTPASASGTIETEIGRAIDTCANAYLFRQISMAKMKAVLDGGLKPSAMEEYKESAQTAQSGVIACAAGMMVVGSKVGMRAEELE